MYKDYSGGGGQTGERVSHQTLDVAAWEGVGLEVQRQTAESNEEGAVLLREWHKGRADGTCKD